MTTNLEIYENWTTCTFALLEMLWRKHSSATELLTEAHVTSDSRLQTDESIDWKSAFVKCMYSNV